MCLFPKYTKNVFHGMTKKEELDEDVKVEGSISYSDHEIVEFSRSCLEEAKQ